MPIKKILKDFEQICKISRRRRLKKIIRRTVAK